MYTFLNVCSILLSVIAQALKRVQSLMADYFKDCYKDDLFAWNNESQPINLDDLYIPVHWTTYTSTPSEEIRKELEDYYDIFSQVKRWLIGMDNFLKCVYV